MSMLTWCGFKADRLNLRCNQIDRNPDLTYVRGQQIQAQEGIINECNASMKENVVSDDGFLIKTVTWTSGIGTLYHL